MPVESEAVQVLKYVSSVLLLLMLLLQVLTFEVSDGPPSLGQGRLELLKKKSFMKIKKSRQKCLDKLSEKRDFENGIILLLFLLLVVGEVFFIKT